MCGRNRRDAGMGWSQVRLHPCTLRLWPPKAITVGKRKTKGDAKANKAKVQEKLLIRSSRLAENRAPPKTPAKEREKVPKGMAENWRCQG